MPEFFKKHHRLLFYSGWIILAILQASFTELQDDEAYYWVYSKFLAWGYFDHPSMIALLIKAGTFFGNAEITVRLFPLILNVLTLVIIEKLINVKNPVLFYIISLSLGILHVAGFFAVPDVPLIFFTALLFLVYKYYLKNPGWGNALLIGIITSCLLYSKYHGGLIILFILLSNPKLFLDKKIYLAGFIALGLFLPHLWWQYNHHWVTFTYQLFERSSGGYDITYTTDYFLGQLLVTGPLAGLILLPATFLYKPVDFLEKALKFSAIGILIFFFLSSFKGRVEANWTAPALISIIVLGHQYLLAHQAWEKWFYKLLPFSLAIILFVRVVTIFNLVPVEPLTERYFAWKKWPSALISQTKSFPVVFKSNYQRASKYWFYSGNTTYSLNDYRERQNNYNFWPVEDSLLGKKVYIMDIYKPDSFPQTIQTPMWKIGYGMDSNFYSFVKIRIESDQNKYAIQQSDSLQLQFNSFIPPQYLEFLKQHPEINPPVLIGAFQNTYIVKDIVTDIKLQDIINKKRNTVSILPTLPPGNYALYFAIGSSTGHFTRNNERIKLTVK